MTTAREALRAQFTEMLGEFIGGTPYKPAPRFDLTVDQLVEAAQMSQREDARAAMRMVREAIEKIGPVADLESEGATLLRGPAITDEASSIVEAIGRIAGALQRRASGEPDWFWNGLDPDQNGTSPEDAMQEVPLWEVEEIGTGVLGPRKFAVRLPTGIGEVDEVLVFDDRATAELAARGRRTAIPVT